MILYIIQANIALAFFAILYRYLLSNDTLFTLRRAVLLMIICVSFTFQFMPAIADINIYASGAESTLLIVQQTTDATAAAISTHATTPSMANIIAIIWLIGCALLTIRFILGFIAIIQIKLQGTQTVVNNHKVILINRELTPFSFYRWIFISPSQLSNENLQDIMIHENAHIKGQHTIDVLISELLVILFWFNPAAWFIRYAIRENLEFLADKNVLDCGHNRKEYQYNLLKLSYQPSVNNIVNYFNVSQLKNRIIMMNREKTPRKAVLKYVLLLPALMLLSLTNNAQTKEKKENNIVVTGYRTQSDTIKLRGNVKPLIIIDNQESTQEELNKLNPENIASISVLKDSSSTEIYGAKGKDGTILVITKQGKDNVKLNDVVVVGYGSMKEGTYITKKLTADGDKLIIVDGKEMSEKELSNLDKESIQSISVLKDETAIKQYGDRGKNGVIVVVLKK